MKRKILITFLALVLVLSACGKKDNETVKETNVTDKTQEETNATDDTKETENKSGNNKTDMSGEVTYEKLMSIPPTPLEEFELGETPEGDLALGIYKGTDPMVYIADEYDGKKVVKIQGYAYNHNPYVKAIRLGKNLKVLEKGVFGSNEVLEIFVSEGLEVVGDGAFVSAKALRDVRLNEGLKEIQDTAFSNVGENLKELVIPKSVEKIGRGAFTLNPNLVVKGYPGSIAKEEAEKYDTKYEEIKE